VKTGEPAVAIHQRSDVCAVPAAGVVAEAMVALVVADAVTEKFGGDSVPEVRRNVKAYLDTLGDTLPIVGLGGSSADAPDGVVDLAEVPASAAP
jgi:chorismate synthase